MEHRHKLRNILCPVCIRGKLLHVVAKMDLIGVNTYPPSQSLRAELFVKCPKCKNQIGISIKH